MCSDLRKLCVEVHYGINYATCGLVDAHTHPVWAGDRVHEFAMKLAGATYMDIHKAGGGIGYTVNKTKKATEEELYLFLEERIARMMSTGTTLAEVKTGYGLDAENEAKLLRILNKADANLPIDLSITFLGAHSIPEGLTAEAATQNVLQEQIPMVEKFQKTKDISVDNIDVFCEKGVFDLEQTKRVLEAGRNIGLHINFHGDELSPIGAAEMGASLQDCVISHLEEISDSGIQAMAQNDCIAVLLPTTAFILKLKPPPVRKMIDAGIVIALGTDFNPNCFCLSMPMTMYLACILFGMTMEEALVASTINAAASLKKSHVQGSLEVGKKADFLVLDAPSWEHLIYQFGGHDKIIQQVVKEGKIIFNRKTC